VRKPQVKNESFCVAFGQHLRELREQQGYSMREFAANLDIEYNQLHLIETGKINTSISMVQLIAEGLGLPVHQLFTFKFPVKR
jgi:transcriptional regulator with XRE-family HTH domain